MGMSFELAIEMFTTGTTYELGMQRQNDTTIAISRFSAHFLHVRRYCFYTSPCSREDARVRIWYEFR
ncbi:hypothetical protein G7K_6495-t1 [Saitoella complicata NRRL Y-17804]|uniref:Uncharacterized protein n=1 Tax=Saitoella complicata (strain BCRC 22490 / CBS 7301 / JCM 7358 / NBRC 10748 / NRRL Y-17804) TaxID=698492 RepID=A0A0E9NRD3_SAICN|nr:hypothetical protein G7K_6495-t1 [Saitoella complicata NRRL Y-17804]